MKIHIVTPSFNQREYLQRCFESVIWQSEGLNYDIRDGGSTDGSVELIESLVEGAVSSHPDTSICWTSEADGGQSRAIEASLNESDAEVMGWLNSDDFLVPGALQVVRQVFSRFPEVEWITSLFPAQASVDGMIVNCGTRGGYNREAFFAGRYLPGFDWPAQGYIQQDCCFWRRGLWERSGSRLVHGEMAFDFDLWQRFFEHADLYTVAAPIGVFRFHEAQKTADQKTYDESARRIIKRSGKERLPGKLKRTLKVRLVPHLRSTRFDYLLGRWGLLDHCPMIRHTGRGGDWETFYQWW